MYYLATLSKLLSPGLRIAYLVTPGRAQAARLATALHAMAVGPAPLLAGLVTAWMQDGSALALAAAVRAEAAARQALAHEHLGNVGLAAHPAGLHAWLELPAHRPRLEFAAVGGLGLALLPADAFLVDGEAPNAVRIALGAAVDRGVLSAGLRAMAAAAV